MKKSKPKPIINNNKQICPTMKMTYCKECNSRIESGLCGFGCSNDSTFELRDPKTIELRVYKFSHIEKYKD